MTDYDALLGTLDDMPIQQLEQLNRLLDAARRYLPRENLTMTQAEQRARRIGKAVARLRAGVSDADLERMIRDFQSG